MFTERPTPRGTRARAAHVLSIVGHPAVLLPAAVAVVAAGAGPAARAAWPALAMPVVLAALVVVYGLVQVRRGRWRNVDASQPGERAELNLLLMALLAGGAVMLWVLEQPATAVVTLGLGACIVAVAHAVRGQLKLSQHAAFAVYAAALLESQPVAASLCLLLAFGVAWSRVVLGRHTRTEVVLGLVTGAAAGFCLRLLSV